LAQPEPDRTLVEVHQTSCPLRPLPSEVRQLSSRHPRNPRRHSDHVRPAAGDADDAQLSAIRRCFTNGRVRYIAADELYDGPFCVLSIVDNRTFKRLSYHVLDRDPTQVDVEAFFRRFRQALE